MWADIRRKKAKHEAWFKPSTRRYLLVEYISIMDELSRMIGCAPPSLREYTLCILFTKQDDQINLATGCIAAEQPVSGKLQTSSLSKVLLPLRNFDPTSKYDAISDGRLFQQNNEWQSTSQGCSYIDVWNCRQLQQVCLK